MDTRPSDSSGLISAARPLDSLNAAPSPAPIPLSSTRPLSSSDAGAQRDWRDALSLSSSPPQTWASPSLTPLSTPALAEAPSLSMPQKSVMTQTPPATLFWKRSNGSAAWATTGDTWLFSYHPNDDYNELQQLGERLTDDSKDVPSTLHTPNHPLADPTQVFFEPWDGLWDHELRWWASTPSQSPTLPSSPSPCPTPPPSADRCMPFSDPGSAGCDSHSGRDTQYPACSGSPDDGPKCSGRPQSCSSPRTTSDAHDTGSIKRARFDPGSSHELHLSLSQNLPSPKAEVEPEVEAEATDVCRGIKSPLRHDPDYLPPFLPIMIVPTVTAHKRSAGMPNRSSGESNIEASVETVNPATIDSTPTSAVSNNAYLTSSASSSASTPVDVGTPSLEKPNPPSKKKAISKGAVASAVSIDSSSSSVSPVRKRKRYDKKTPGMALEGHQGAMAILDPSAASGEEEPPYGPIEVDGSIQPDYSLMTLRDRSKGRRMAVVAFFWKIGNRPARDRDVIALSREHSIPLNMNGATPEASLRSLICTWCRDAEANGERPPIHTYRDAASGLVVRRLAKHLWKEERESSAS
ncbi:uncharacterized protein BJ171DRAFT_489560 [Polychytrium aggregatum]|uniref:uncharacterized protein n=1 Tax=Polychytrium aggregatum TaxID=110093 RepID=UPI0022FE7E3D|nr:uncharacterized protein BJ171DRAFT_489560 [Polychytrium aggregatum]KAI9208637.1 hypothetical protein BJ171DRAFT_489560 [Polychytrium aggregatum]